MLSDEAYRVAGIADSSSLELIHHPIPISGQRRLQLGQHHLRPFCGLPSKDRFDPGIFLAYAGHVQMTLKLCREILQLLNNIWEKLQDTDKSCLSQADLEKLLALEQKILNQLESEALN